MFYIWTSQIVREFEIWEHFAEFWSSNPEKTRLTLITLSFFVGPPPFPYCVCCCSLSSVLHLYTIVTGLADVADWCLSSTAPGSADDESFLSCSWFDEFVSLPAVFAKSPGRDIVKCACTVHSAVISAILLLDILFYPRPTHARPMIYILFNVRDSLLLSSFFLHSQSRQYIYF